jgi:hypothetical protein
LSAIFCRGQRTPQIGCAYGLAEIISIAGTQIARVIERGDLEKSRPLALRDRWFESISLQRRVHCEPDFLGHGQDPKRRELSLRQVQLRIGIRDNFAAAGPSGTMALASRGCHKSDFGVLR